MWYNVERIRQTLRVTRAMEAGVSDHVWSVAELVAMHPLEARRMMKRVKLPPEVAAIYLAVKALQKRYVKYGRKFTPDGHLVGSIGEVIAAEALGLTLHKTGRPGVDAYDANGGDVQIKMTSGKSIGLYDNCARLVVLRIVSPDEAEIVYDGPGAPVWECAGQRGKHGQRIVSLAKIQRFARPPDSN